MKDKLAPYLHLLGTCRNKEIATLAGCTSSAVSRYRAKLGIPVPPKPSTGVDKPTGCTSDTVRRRRARLGVPALGKLASYLHLLGTCLDREIAALAGCTSSAVSFRRRQLGIPSYNSKPKPPGELGTMPDGVLAQKLGVSANAIMHRRQRLGIPAYRHPHPCDRLRWAFGRFPLRVIGIFAGYKSFHAQHVCNYARKRGISIPRNRKFRRFRPVFRRLESCRGH